MECTRARFGLPTPLRPRAKGALATSLIRILSAEIVILDGTIGAPDIDRVGAPD